MINLGIYHLDIGDRVKAWGTQGALWGGLWGFLVGAGFFMISGIGAVAAAGYIVEAIAGGIAAGAGHDGCCCGTVSIGDCLPSDRNS